MLKDFEIKTLDEKDLPEMLQEISDAPAKIYFQGLLPSPETKLLCIVGSRKYSQYGKDVCEKLISGLRGYNICIVSGLALGIDGIAHKSALDAGLKTIAVPGSGLHESVLYPSSHRQLAEKILEKIEPGTVSTSLLYSVANLEVISVPDFISASMTSTA